MSNIIEKMNQALGLELRAINMYAHYAAYVKGMHRLQLEPMFQERLPNRWFTQLQFAMQL